MYRSLPIRHITASLKSPLRWQSPFYAEEETRVLRGHDLNLAPNSMTPLLRAKMTIVVQSLCYIWLFVTPWTAARQASLSLTISWSLLKLMSFESVMPSNHLILCHPLLLLPSIFLSIRVFPNESAFHIKWPNSWSFSFSISPSNEYSELISFRIDWFDFLAVQRTLKSFLQHHISKASILWLSDFFVVQLTCVHKYWKTIVGQYGPLSAKWRLCFLIHCLGLSYLFFQGASVF